MGMACLDFPGEGSLAVVLKKGVFALTCLITQGIPRQAKVRDHLDFRGKLLEISESLMTLFPRANGLYPLRTKHTAPLPLKRESPYRIRLLPRDEG